MFSVLLQSIFNVTTTWCCWIVTRLSQSLTSLNVCLGFWLKQYWLLWYESRTDWWAGGVFRSDINKWNQLLLAAVGQPQAGQHVRDAKLPHFITLLPWTGAMVSVGSREREKGKMWRHLKLRVTLLFMGTNRLIWTQQLPTDTDFDQPFLASFSVK